jgi:amidase
MSNRHRAVDEVLDATDATGLAAAIGRGEVTASEVLDATAARLRERNPAVNAVVADRLDAARDEVDAGLPRGPLRGVPFVVKALGGRIAGLATTNGSALWRDAVAPADSEVVARYRRAGLVLVGLTNTPELGQSPSTEPLLHGPARNPHRLSHSPGGSSGGTAAAVAAGIVPAGHGTDGGGSIRIPASMCGLVGLKPTRGRVPSAPGYSSFASPLSIAHAITRSVRDSALLLDVAAGSVPGDAFVTAPNARPYVDEVAADPGALRIAVDTCTPRGEDVAADRAEVVEQTASLLRELGHAVTPGRPDYPVDAILDALRTFFAVTTSAQVDARLAELGRELEDGDLEPFTFMIYASAKGLTGEDVYGALAAIERSARALGQFFVDHDVLVTPTVAPSTPELGLLDVTDLEAMSSNAGKYAALTSPFNVTGQPALSLPLGSDRDGIPVGVQFVAAFGREDVLLRLGSQLEAAAPWSTRPVWPARD